MTVTARARLGLEGIVVQGGRPEKEGTVEEGLEVARRLDQKDWFEERGCP